MTIESILVRKGRDVVTVTGSQSVLEAVHTLVDNNIGAVVVVDGRRTIGILTERDILQLTSRSHGTLGQIRVDEVMTRDLLTASSTDDLKDTMGVMTEHKIRHLPVLDGDELAGIVSIGDLVNECRLSAESENTHLREYIRGAG